MDRTYSWGWTTDCKIGKGTFGRENINIGFDEGTILTHILGHWDLSTPGLNIDASIGREWSNCYVDTANAKYETDSKNVMWADIKYFINTRS